MKLMKLANFVKGAILFFIFIFFYFLIAVSLFYFTKLPSLIVFCIAIGLPILITWFIENQMRWTLVTRRMKKLTAKQEPISFRD